MLNGRKGFTLIELLIVVVIIGILAAIAIPKFSKTREKTYFSAMKSDLKNLATQQEIYYSDPVNVYHYADDPFNTALGFAPSQGVYVDITSATGTGWSATATHAALDAATQYCGVFYGGAASVGLSSVAGVVACTGE
jgi:prepilin-type N-terminal cleavage/methylation domain-containing protein